MKNTILIVDDNGFDRGLLTKALRKKGGYSILEASSGEDCLSKIENNKIDLVLMDIMMPGTFGTQVLVKIRENYNQIELPIIMVTSKNDTSDIINSLQKGANDYITKPVNFDVAISRISTHLKLADLSRMMSSLKEMAALDAMITTYNHEINNPLTIAIGCLQRGRLDDSANVQKLEEALWRISDIVKKIREVTEKKEVELSHYPGSSSLIKLGDG